MQSEQEVRAEQYAHVLPLAVAGVQAEPLNGPVELPARHSPDVKERPHQPQPGLFFVHSAAVVYIVEAHAQSAVAISQRWLEQVPSSGPALVPAVQAPA